MRCIWFSSIAGGLTFKLKICKKQFISFHFFTDVHSISRNQRVKIFTNYSTILHKRAVLRYCRNYFSGIKNTYMRWNCEYCFFGCRCGSWIYDLRVMSWHNSSFKKLRKVKFLLVFQYFQSFTFSEHLCDFWNFGENFSPKSPQRKMVKIGGKIYEKQIIK